MVSPSVEPEAESYAEWLAGHHARMPVTDAEVLADAVRAATGEAVARWERIVAGEVNEVYAATVISGVDFIVRVSRRPTSRFKAERWALDAARAVGVPAPEMLHLEEGEDSNGHLAICVENRLPGRPLGTVDDASDREHLAALTGEIAARLHTVAVDGFGYVRGDGTGPMPSWARCMRSEQSESDLARIGERAIALGIPPEWIREASAELHDHDDLFASVEPRLLHGDLSSAHVLVDGRSVTGLIDFEQAYAGDPAFDLVWWNYFRHEAPIDWVIAGYLRVADIGDDLELRMRLGRLRLHLGLTDFYGGVGRTNLGPVVRANFADDAAWFGFTAPSSDQPS